MAALAVAGRFAAVRVVRIAGLGSACVAGVVFWLSFNSLAVSFANLLASCFTALAKVFCSFLVCFLFRPLRLFCRFSVKQSGAGVRRFSWTRKLEWDEGNGGLPKRRPRRPTDWEGSAAEQWKPSANNLGNWMDLVDKNRLKP